MRGLVNATLAVCSALALVCAGFMWNHRNGGLVLRALVALIAAVGIECGAVLAAYIFLPAGDWRQFVIVGAMMIKMIAIVFLVHAIVRKK